MELLGDMGRVESHIGPFGDGVNVCLDRSMVSAKSIIGSKIILDTPDGTPRWRGLSEARFSPFVDSANLQAW
jgi:hypothetical protein